MNNLQVKEPAFYVERNSNRDIEVESKTIVEYIESKYTEDQQNELLSYVAKLIHQSRTRRISNMKRALSEAERNFRNFQAT